MRSSSRLVAFLLGLACRSDVPEGFRLEIILDDAAVHRIDTLELVIDRDDGFPGLAPSESQGVTVRPEQRDGDGELEALVTWPASFEFRARNQLLLGVSAAAPFTAMMDAVAFESGRILARGEARLSVRTGDVGQLYVRCLLEGCAGPDAGLLDAADGPVDGKGPAADGPSVADAGGDAAVVGEDGSTDLGGPSDSGTGDDLGSDAGSLCVSSGWSTEDLVTGSVRPSLDVDGEGQVHAAFAPLGALYYRRRPAPPSGSWGTYGYPDTTCSGSCTHPSLAVDDEGGVHVAYGRGAGGELRYVYRAPGASSFGAPEIVLATGSGAGFSGVSLAVDGTMPHVSYMVGTSIFVLGHAFREGDVWTAASVGKAEISTSPQTDIAVGADGWHIAYYGTISSLPALKHATASAIETVPCTGGYSGVSIALGPTGDVYVAVAADAGGFCVAHREGTTWLPTLSTEVSYPCSTPSIELADGTLHLGYARLVSDTAEVRYWRFDADDLTPFYAAEAVSDGGDLPFLSLALGTSGLVHLASGYPFPSSTAEYYFRCP